MVLTTKWQTKMVPLLGVYSVIVARKKRKNIQFTYFN